MTPRGPMGRMEAVAVNAAVHCGGVQVRPGDLALADATGVCLVPIDLADEVIARVVGVTDAEAASTATS